MKRFDPRVDRQGRVTIPAAVRKNLGIFSPRGALFEVEDGQTRLRAGQLTIDDIAGILPPLPAGMTIDEAIELAAQEHDLHVYNEGRYD